MGYYSHFDIEIHSDRKFSIEEVTKKLSEISGYDLIEDFESCEKEEKIFCCEVNDVKWYSYEEDFIELSKIFPDFIFFVSRLGEYETDYIEQVFKNGKSTERNLVVIYPKWEDNSENEQIFKKYRPQQF